MLSPTRKPPRRATGALIPAIAVAATLLALVLLPLGGTPSAQAQSADELRAKADGARERAAELAASVSAQRNRLAATRQRAAAAAAREQQLAATLAGGRERAAELAAAVEHSRERLRAARAELRRSRAQLSKRLVAIYKSGGVDELALILSADGFDDLAVRNEYLQRIQSADRAMVTRAQDLRAAVDEQLSAVAAARDQQLAHNAEVASAHRQIAGVRARAEAGVGALATELRSGQAALGELQTRIEQWQQQVQRAERISAAEAEQEVSRMTDDWAIPESIVECESGGNHSALNPSSGAGGAYQIIPSTWQSYGGKGQPHKASPAEQARIAAQIWADSGSSAWECAG
jgi:septal ring factor EnvC (AmiA/AmiB activator)